ncbi:uncharacterized protein LOC109860609 [Pseudomyrmex gracilis]|uniref:uncharacterized protein LOC109860609 n=1 Tax=Pseudomyrmex gracilis TaxID=219809 RepID=UPI000995764D|nr:uncharacterized protein LOC109860609 [Pseudomyrmex gracilis]
MDQPVCPVDSSYHEVDHEIDNNILSIKVPRDKRSVQREEENGKAIKPTSVIDTTCLNKYGKKCEKSCTRVKVVHDRKSLRKTSEEELLLLRSIRQITPSDDIKYSLEVELKSPRNYTPLPKLGPPPPIIIPKEPVVTKNQHLDNHGARENEKAEK